MGAAVREAASNLQSSSDAMVEQRRLNAQHERRVLVDLPLASVLTDDLSRDRIDLESVAASDEMRPRALRLALAMRMHWWAGFMRRCTK